MPEQLRLPDAIAEAVEVGGETIVAETHSAFVACLGDLAYKWKKAVRLPFVDFSTIEAREAACRREVELNSRLASDVYLGVADLRDDHGAVVEHVVVMKRMQDGDRLTELLRRGVDVTPALAAIAHQLATLHGASPARPEGSRVGEPASLSRLWHDIADELEGLGPRARAMLSDSDRARLTALADRYTDGREALFASRIAHGRIVDGHGDLRAEDIFVTAAGPRVLDCLDFDDDLRWGDGLGDVAFLAMDLEDAGRTDLALRFVATYRELTADNWPPSLLHHYVAYRAGVRLKVAAVRLGQHDAADADGASDAAEGARLAAMALRHLEAGRVRAVMVGGLPGTGKSVLSRTLGDRMGAVVLSTDEVRRELARTDSSGAEARPDEQFGEGRYTAAARAEVYTALRERAAHLLGMGEHVVLDASWSDRAEREATRAMCAALSADLDEIRCTAPDAVARGRIEQRRVIGTDPSEATPMIAAAMAEQFDPWPEAVGLDTHRPAQVVSAEMLQQLAVRSGP